MAVSPGEAVVVVSVMTLVLGIVIGLPWLLLHYVVQWRKAGAMKAEDERMLEDVWRASRTMERRLEALETIVEKEAPDMRRVQEI